MTSRPAPLLSALIGLLAAAPPLTAQNPALDQLTLEWSADDDGLIWSDDPLVEYTDHNGFSRFRVTGAEDATGWWVGLHAIVYVNDPQYFVLNPETEYENLEDQGTWPLSSTTWGYSDDYPESIIEPAAYDSYANLIVLPISNPLHPNQLFQPVLRPGTAGEDVFRPVEGAYFRWHPNTTFWWETALAAGSDADVLALALDTRLVYNLNTFAHQVIIQQAMGELDDFKTGDFRTALLYDLRMRVQAFAVRDADLENNWGNFAVNDVGDGPTGMISWPPSLPVFATSQHVELKLTSLNKGRHYPGWLKPLIPPQMVPADPGETVEIAVSGSSPDMFAKVKIVGGAAYLTATQYSAPGRVLVGLPSNVSTGDTVKITALQDNQGTVSIASDPYLFTIQ